MSLMVGAASSTTSATDGLPAPMADPPHPTAQQLPTPVVALGSPKALFLSIDKGGEVVEALLWWKERVEGN